MGTCHVNEILQRIVRALLFVCGISGVDFEVSASATVSHRCMVPSVAARRISSLKYTFPLSELECICSSRGGSQTNERNDDAFINNNATLRSKFNIALGSTTSNEVAIGDTTVQFQKQCDERSAYIKDVLHRRHQHVLHGKRMKDVTTWMKEHQNEDPTESIISIHGLSHKSSNHKAQTSTNSPSCLVATEPPKNVKLPKKINKHDPFPFDRRNLNVDIHSSLPSSSQQQNKNAAPVSCFVDITGEISLETQSPTMLQLGTRMVQLLVNFAPIWSTMGVAMFSPTFRQRYWYKWIRHSIGKSGAAWIKWGQWSATRNDIFPEALCDELSTLHASAPAHPWSYSALIIEQSLGLGFGTLHCVFDDIDTQPIASGSIAQVHKAVLCGQPLAIKIRHPNVQQLMEMDFQLMTFGASLMDKIPALSWLHIKDSVVQFSNAIVAQAYLQVEAHHLEVLNYNFRNWPRVSFPKPIFASSSIIIETFESGKITTDIIDKYNKMAKAISHYQNGGIHDFNNKNGVTVIEVESDSDSDENIDETSTNDEILSGYDLIPVKLAKFLVCSGVSLYLKMLLIDNLMHADLHPGNIVVDTIFRRTRRQQLLNNEMRIIEASAANLDHDNTLHTADLLKAMDDTAIDEIRITLVDAGMVVKLTDEESSAFIGLLSSLGEGNGDEAAAYTLQFSLERNSMTVAQKRFFAADMVLLFQERCRGYGTNVDVGYVLRGVLSLIRKHRVRIDANFATLVINCLCLESLARGVCPTYNVLDAGRPLLQGYRRFVNQQSAQRPESTPWFLFRMSLNAFKKNLDDRRFFRKQAKQKYAVRQAVEKLIQPLSK